MGARPLYAIEIINFEDLGKLHFRAPMDFSNY